MKLTIQNPISFCKDAPIVGYYLVSVGSVSSAYTFRLLPNSGGDELIITLSRESDKMVVGTYGDTFRYESGYSVEVTIGHKLMGGYFTYEQIRERRPLTDWINRITKQ